MQNGWVAIFLDSFCSLFLHIVNCFSMLIHRSYVIAYTVGVKAHPTPLLPVSPPWLVGGLCEILEGEVHSFCYQDILVRLYYSGIKASSLGEMNKISKNERDVFVAVNSDESFLPSGRLAAGISAVSGWVNLENFILSFFLL